MRNLLSIILVIICLVASLDTVGQLKRFDLEGDWQTNNQDSLYYRIDTVEMYLDINHFMKIETCNSVSWRTDNGKFKFISSYLCSEPGIEEWSTEKEKLSIEKRDFGQVIQLKRSGQIFEQFKIIELKESRVERYPFDIKQLTVLRFDHPAEQKLYNYVDSLVFDVLGYEPTALDSGMYREILKNAAATTTTIRIRHENDKNPKPILIINGYPTVNFDILKEFLFVEATAINHLTKEQSASLYGARAINGAIVVQTSIKKFKKAWKKYDG